MSVNERVLRKVDRDMVRCAAVLLLPLVACSSGCHLLGLLGPDEMKTVPAEYPYMAGKRVCIVVRAGMETLSIYPHVQLEVADHVRVQLEANVKGTTVVEPRKIVDLQRSDPDWEKMDPAALGKRFGADRVLECDLTQYTTREPESDYMYRGHISAALRVFDTEYPNSQPTFQTQVQTVYPKDGPGKWGSDDRAIRRATMEIFAQDVAFKFYDHKVKVY
jgi:hypothetical protein